MNLSKVAEALHAAGFTLAGRSRGGRRYHWPGDNHPRSSSLFVPTGCYPEEQRQYEETLLTELRRAVEVGDAARAVLAAIDTPATERTAMDQRLLDAAETFGRLYAGMRRAHGSGTEVTARAAKWIGRVSTTKEEYAALDAAYFAGIRAENENPTAASAARPEMNAPPVTRNNVKMTPAELLAALNDPGYHNYETRHVYTTVTPEVARVLLDRYVDPPRRMLSQRNVAWLAYRLMHPDPEGGIWEEVRVREDGTTIAGQHLLHAVLQADTEAEPVWVVLNSDDPFQAREV